MKFKCLYTKSCAWMGVVVIAVAVVMSAQADFGERKLPDGLKAPVLAMELLRRDTGKVEDILGPLGDPGDDRDELTQQIYLDTGFIAAYTTLFALIGLSLYRGGQRTAGSVIWPVAFAAAIFDLLENFAILGLIHEPSATLFPSWLIETALISSAPRRWSLMKWSLIFVLLFPLARIYFDRGLPKTLRRIGYVAGGFVILAATIGLSGILFKIDALIERAATFMGIGLLTGTLFFASYAWLAHGLRAALDRWAELRFFQPLSQWAKDNDE